MRTLRATLTSAALVAVAGMLAAIALASNSRTSGGYEPIVGVSIGCDGAVVWTATAWDGPTRQSRSNPTVAVSEIVDGAEQPITTGGFSYNYQFAFGGSFHTDRDTVTIRAKVIDSWGDRTPGGQTTEAAVSKSPECSPPPADGDGAAAGTTTTGTTGAQTSTGPTATTTVGEQPPSSAEDQYGDPTPTETTTPAETVEQPPPPPPAPNTVVIVYKQRVIVGCAAGFTRLAGSCWMVPR